MSEILNLSVTKQKIYCDRQQLVSDTVNVYECYFTFDEEWDGYTKTAVFMRDKVSYKVLLDENNHCILPWESVEHDGLLVIGVYGIYGTVEEETFKRYPTIFTKTVKILHGCEDGQESLPPSPDVYEQLLSAYAQLAEEVAKK